MDTNLALLLLFAPFAGFLLNIFFGKKIGKGGAGTLGTLAVATSFVVTLTFFLQVLNTGKPVMINLCEWLTLVNFKVNFGFSLISFRYYG